MEIREWLKSFSRCFRRIFSSKMCIERDTDAIQERSQRIAMQFYAMEDHEDYKEITQAVLKSSETKDSIKKLITNTGRRFFLFRYPSDGFKVKGYVSFVPNPGSNPLLVYLRGGNRIFGLPNPGSDYSSLRNYTVLATTYRDGVSEGIDEFGVGDVNDVDNLLRFLPVIGNKLGIAFHPKRTFMLGSSRGGMEMFLALSRSEYLQNQIDKAASLCGLLDMRRVVASRNDMKEMFIEDYGLIPSVNEDAWVRRRDPIESVGSIRNDLPFLIVQGSDDKGSDDIRVDRQQGLYMIEKLRENGHPVSYLEIEGGDHCLRNKPDSMERIADWFESGDTL